MLTRSATVASLILLAATAVMAGDAMAQLKRPDARGADRVRVERPAPVRVERPAHSRIEREVDRSHAGHRDERGADHRALSAAVRRVERRTGGQVLSAERVPYDGRDINRIKVVDARGRVRVYVEDPRARNSPDRLRTRGDDN